MIGTVFVEGGGTLVKGYVEFGAFEECSTYGGVNLVGILYVVVLGGDLLDSKLNVPCAYVAKIVAVSVVGESEYPFIFIIFRAKLLYHN